MLKRLMIGLIFIGIVLSSVNIISALPNVYCYDGTTTSCIHDEYEQCNLDGNSLGAKAVLNSPPEENYLTVLRCVLLSGTGYDVWGETVVQDCLKSVKSVIGTSSLEMTCLKDCFKTGGFCTTDTSYEPKGGADEKYFCENYLKNSGAICASPDSCNPNEFPQITVSDAGQDIINIESYPNNPDKDYVAPGGEYEAVNVKLTLINASKFSSCEINWHNPSETDYSSKWRGLTSLSNVMTVWNLVPGDIYQTVGSKTISVRCFGTCPTIVRESYTTYSFSLPEDGKCGLADEKTDVANEVDLRKIELCAAGSETPLQFNENTNTWAWQCQGSSKADSCSATKKIQDINCGNGFVNEGEECDDGNLNDGDGCSSTCEFELIPPDPTEGCEEGFNLCSDGNCSLNCVVADDGDGPNSCTNPANDGLQDGCASGLVCSFQDSRCCKITSDGVCDSLCGNSDPDCGEVPSPSYCTSKPVVKCGDYTQEQCGTDYCKVAGSTNIDYLEGTKSKSQGCYITKTPSCSWDGTKCATVWKTPTIDFGCPSGTDYPDNIGSCTYEDTTEQTCSGEREFIDISWEAFWNWGVGNEVSQIDPEGYHLECKEGVRPNVPCPSSVALSFFTPQNSAIVIGVIVLIYILWSLKKRRDVQEVKPIRRSSKRAKKKSKKKRR